MGGCGEGRKQGGVSRRGNRKGRDIDLTKRPIDRERHRSEPEREREREQSTDLSEELEAFGFEQNQEIKRVG